MKAIQIIRGLLRFALQNAITTLDNYAKEFNNGTYKINYN